MARAVALFHNRAPVLNKETLMTRFSGAVPAALALLLIAPSGAQAQAQDPNLARNLAATCANCHGTNGNARGEMKVLAGRPAAATIALMAAYKNGSLPATIMHQIAKGYTDEQIKLVADYLAAQQPTK
jgi:cytochrome subunit of sulfide dehydrogenase